MEIIKKVKIEKVVFKNGLVLEVGDRLEDGRIFGIEEREEGIEVICVDRGEGFSYYYNKDGEEVGEF
jgi:hypothetical protein